MLLGDASLIGSALQIKTRPKEKKNKLAEFNNLMMLLEGGILDKCGLPSSSLIALSNYFQLANDNKESMWALTKSWDKKFFLRQSITNKPVERWDLQRLVLGQEWELNRHEILPLLKSTGLLSSRFPRYGHYDTLIIHGARREDIWPRLQFITKFWQQGGRFERIAVLTGQRLLTSDELESLPKDISNEITLMKHIWQSNQIIPHEIRELPIVWVNTPNFIEEDGQLRRGTTEDTIIAWLDTEPLGKDFHWGSCLAVANAPLILRQHVVFERILYERKQSSTIETVGLCEEKEGAQWLIYYLREIAALLWELQQLDSYINSPLHF